MNTFENQITETLNQTNGSTICRLQYTTTIKPAAKHKAVNIQKTTIASALLFGKVSAYANAYKRRVQKTALEIEGNNQEAIDNFEVSQNWHVPSERAYSIRLHTGKGTKYLYPMFCGHSKTVFTIDGNPATREQVAEFLTPSAAKDLMNTSGIVTNKKNGIKHRAIVRTIGIENIEWCKIKGKLIEA
jgi:hypothetical protein